MTRDEIRKRVDTLNAMILQGEIMAAMREFYAERFFYNPQPVTED